MHKLVITYQELQDSEYFLKLVRLGKKEGVTPEQIINLIQMADKIYRFKEKFQQLQSDVIELGMKKSVGKERLETLQNEIEAAQEKLDSVNKAFKIKYGELKEACS